VSVTVARRELTLQDRCDSCGAAAKIIATFLNGELLFCGHHARKAGSACPRAGTFAPGSAPRGKTDQEEQEAEELYRASCRDRHPVQAAQTH